MRIRILRVGASDEYLVYPPQVPGLERAERPWRETLLAQRVLQGGTRGWRNHPQLDRFKGHVKPMEAVCYYLLEVHAESLRRGYSYDFSKILEPSDTVKQVTATRGQLDYELRVLNERLARRDPEKLKENHRADTVDSHPLF